LLITCVTGEYVTFDETMLEWTSRHKKGVTNMIGKPISVGFLIKNAACSKVKIVQYLEYQQGKTCDGEDGIRE
jgi:hypothetical protein